MLQALLLFGVGFLIGMLLYRSVASARKPLRWRLIIAAVLGASFALWLLSGDTTPEAQAPLVTSIDVVITQYHGREMDNGVDFYRIETGRGSGVLSVDRDVAILATYLKTHQGLHKLTLEAR